MKRKIRRRCKCSCGRITNIGRRWILGHHDKTKLLIRKIRRKCKCGCGDITNYGKRWIGGHHGRGVRFSEESKLKISKALTGRRLSKEHIIKISLANEGQKRSKEAKLNMSLGQLKRYNSKLPYCGVWYDKEYEKDIKKDYCENSDCENDYKRLSRHHAYLDKKRCAPNEIITLCNSCHVILHRLLEMGKHIPANPKDYIIINRSDHISYIHKQTREIIRINKRGKKCV